MLERVFFRLASASTDDELTCAVAKFLPSCLLKLSSSQEGVRKKVLELLVHINKRVKSNDNVQLPMEALLIQYQDPSATSFVTNFTIIYIKMGFPRMCMEKKASLVPSILRSLEGKPTSHQDSLLAMILPMLGHIESGTDNDDKKKHFLGLSEKPGISKLLNGYILDYLLLPYGSHPSIKPSDPNETIKVPAGLSEASWKRVAGDELVKPEQLEKNKVGLVKFLGSGLMPEKDVAMHLLIAMADTRHRVASEADSVMRRFSSIIDWNEHALVGKVYDMFLGTLVMKGKDGKPVSKNVKAEDRRVAANTRLRLKFMPYLLRSREAASQFPACIQVVFDLLFGTGGNSNAKLKAMAVSYIHHIIEFCPEQRLASCGGVLLSALKRLVSTKETDNGSTAAEPEIQLTHAEKTGQAKLRASCYVAIGKLGLKLPQLVNQDLTIIQTFFEAMSTEDKETQLSVQEALSMMAPSFRKVDQANLSMMEALLATYIEQDEHQVRLAAVHYAGQVFPATHTNSKFILILGAGDAKDEVAQAAKSHLYKAKQLPDFTAMTSLILEKARTRSNQAKHVVGNHVLAFTPKVYTEVLNYCRLCLMASSGVLNPDLEMLTRPQEEAPQVTRFLASSANNADAKKVIPQLVGLAEAFLQASQGLAQVQCLVQLVGCSGNTDIRKGLIEKLSWLKSLLANTKEEFREASAHLFGLVASSGLDNGQFEKVMVELQRGFKDKPLETQHGIILALGHTYSYKTNLASSQGCKDSTELVLAQLDSGNGLLMAGACLALAELGRATALPLSDDKKLGLVDTLLTIMKNGKVNMRVRERAALALGVLCIGDATFPHRDNILKGFLESAKEMKEVELHFTVGEALVYAALGPLSAKGRDLWSVSEEAFEAPVNVKGCSDKYLRWLVDELTDKYTVSSHPNEKQASCIWLLALVKHATQQEVVKTNLLRIQAAFMGLLGDNNDLVQDAASKGLGLVYENCSDEQRDKMVGSLLTTLMDGQRKVQPVTGDTKIFDDKEIGRTPTGENLSTYRELCSLATDLNQPDLVYKFMHLANYNAMWNSRKGAAFGFGTIAAKAGQQLEPYLPKIVPKLYRYQFDPTPKIQQSMSSIWSSLVPEPSKTVDKYLLQILHELQTNLTSNQWRVRESCCGALQDLVRGRNLSSPEQLQLLPSIWTDLFRVMDDIKESVRLAAAKAAAAFSRTCIRMCDINQSGRQASQAAIQAILPPLLGKGLSSSVAEVRGVALGLVSKIAKGAGPLLKGHLGQLIPALLEATSEMESQDLGYLSSRLANDADVQEKLDAARIAAAKASPMMECVNQVLQYVDDAESLAALVPRLVDLIKSSIGLGTKGTTASVIITLTHQCPLEMQAYTGKLLAALVTGLGDRNPAVRKTYASAIGHLMKTAKDSSVEKLMVKLRTWYMEEGRDKTAVAYTLQAVARANPDRLKENASQVIPLVYLAMHEEKDSDVLEVWQEVWSDTTPGTEAGTRLYLPEIVGLLGVALDSPQWKVKAQAARAMGSVGSTLGSNVPLKVHQDLLTWLLNGLAGRTWDGKEDILIALADVVAANPAATLDILPDSQVLATCLLKECAKEKLSYRIKALEATGKVLKGLQMDHFKELYEKLLPVIKIKGDDDKMDDGEEEETFPIELQMAVVQCLGQAWPDNWYTQEAHVVPFLTALADLVQQTTKKSQLVIVQCLGLVRDKYKVQNNKDLNGPVFEQVAKIISFTLAMPKSPSLRTESLVVLEKVIREDMKTMVDNGQTSVAEQFCSDVIESVDDVIKDLGVDAATKDKARKIKTSMAPMIPKPQEEL